MVLCAVAYRACQGVGFEPGGPAQGTQACESLGAVCKLQQACIHTVAHREIATQRRVAGEKNEATLISPPSTALRPTPRHYDHANEWARTAARVGLLWALPGSPAEQRPVAWTCREPTQRPPAGLWGR